MANLPKIALVLTGGGARGAYQAGFLRGLSEILPQGAVPFSILTGISVGAINVAYLACRADDFQSATKKLWNMWAELKPDGVFIPKQGALWKNGLRWLAQYVFGHGKKTASFFALLDNKPLRDLLSSEIDFSMISKHLRSGDLHSVAFTATDYNRSKSITFFDGANNIHPWEKGQRLGRRTSLTVDHVVGSAGLPLLFEPVQIGEGYYGDGSMRLTSPLSPAVQLGAEKIMVIATHGHEHGKPKQSISPPSFAGVVGTLLRSAFSDSLDSDLERLKTANHFAEANPSDNRFRNIPSLELQPTNDLGKLALESSQSLPSSFQRILRIAGAQQGGDYIFLSYISFDKTYTVPLLEAGYEDAIAARAQLESFLGVTSH